MDDNLYSEAKFSIEYSGIDRRGIRFNKKESYTDETDAIREMDRLMDIEENIVISLYDNGHVIKSFTRGY